ncbi:MAG: hypothetical protein V4864_17565 [Pseudomonadota bacterium]
MKLLHAASVALAAIALSTAAVAADKAGPVKLSDAQLDKVTAGQPSGLMVYVSNPGNTVYNSAGSYNSSNANASVSMSRRVTVCVGVYSCYP